MLRTCAVVALTVLSLSSVQAQEGAVAKTPETTIHASNSQSARIPADMATLYFVVEGQAVTPDEALTRTGQLEGAVLAALRRIGLGPEQVRATNYGVSPARSSNRTGDGPGGLLIGRSAIRVELRQLDRLGTATAVALSAGATLVGDPRFASTRMDSVRQVLAGRAMAQARRDAEAVAAAAGGRLGRLASVMTDSPSHPSESYPPHTLPTEQMYSGQGRPAPEVVVSVHARATWELATR